MNLQRRSSRWKKTVAYMIARMEVSHLGMMSSAGTWYVGSVKVWKATMINSCPFRKELERQRRSLVDVLRDSGSDVRFLCLLIFWYEGGGEDDRLGIVEKDCLCLNHEG